MRGVERARVPAAIACLIILTLVVASRVPQEAHAQTAALTQSGVIPLPNVNGRIDHLAFDAARHHVFVAALGNNTVEVIDSASNTHVKSLPGFHEPQGVAVLPDADAVAVANGGTGTLQLIDARTLRTRWTVHIGDDADNVRYDMASRQLYVAAAGGLYAVDAAAGRVRGRIAIDGHPESFQIATSGGRVFANLPGFVSSQVVAGDLRSLSVAARWSTPGCNGVYPMALDETRARIYIGCRRPARLEAIDTRSGTVAGSVDIDGDTDDLFFDEIRQRLYVIAGEGFVDVIRADGDVLRSTTRLATRSGARTGLWVPALHRLYVAVPARNGQGAEIRLLDAN